MNVSDAIKEYTKYVSALKYNDTPDYDKCRQMFETGLKKLGEKNSGDLVFNVKSIAGTSKTATAKQTKVGEASPRKRVTNQRSAVEAESDAESEVENKSPRKRLNDEANVASKGKRPKITATKINEKQPSSSSGGYTYVVNSANDLPEAGKTKSKTKNLHLNVQLDVSFDTNIVVQVSRTPKKTVKSESKTKRVQASYDDDDEDVIPDSNENTPVAKVRLSKKTVATSKKTARKSPRMAL